MLEALDGSIEIDGCLYHSAGSLAADSSNFPDLLD